MSLCSLRALSRAASRLAQPSWVRAPAAAASALLPRVVAAVPAPKPLASSMPMRAFHSSSLRRGGHAADDGEFHHGTDFLSRENVERRVKAVLAEVEKIDKTKLQDPNSTFKDLGLDSLDEVEVVMMLEDEFVIDIQDEVASSIVSMQDAINYITQHPFAANDEHH